MTTKTRQFFILKTYKFRHTKARAQFCNQQIRIMPILDTTNSLPVTMMKIIAL